MFANYLSVDGVGRVLLEECIEMRGDEFPQSRGDDARLHRNLILAFAACCYKCPVKPCDYQLAPRSGNVQVQNLERDEAGHLLRLNNFPQRREELI